jgi:hypothetical protein
MICGKIRGILPHQFLVNPSFLQSPVLLIPQAMGTAVRSLVLSHLAEQADRAPDEHSTNPPTETRVRTASSAPFGQKSHVRGHWAILTLVVTERPWLSVANIAHQRLEDKKHAALYREKGDTPAWCAGRPCDPRSDVRPLGMKHRRVALSEEASSTQRSRCSRPAAVARLLLVSRGPHAAAPAPSGLLAKRPRD